MMKKIAVLGVFFLVFSLAAMAQDYPKAEVFGGYSYVHSSILSTGFNFNGASGSIAYNPHPNWGLVADIGGYHTNTLGADASVVTYLFGPKIASRSNERFTPFAQALFGGAHIGSGVLGVSENGFALALGGGVDANVNYNVAVRVGQVEYLLTKFNDGLNDRQTSVRISAGVVFRFGK